MIHPPGKPAELYDFRRPTTLAREHSRVLELAFEAFSRQWATQLTANVRARAQVTFDGVSMHTYDEYVAALPPSTIMVLCAIGDEAARAVIQFPATAALSWFSRMLGGNGKHDENERPLTIIEQTMLRSLASDIIDALTYTLNPIITDHVRVDGVSQNSQFAQAAATTEMMVVSSFTISVGDHAANATLAIPSEVLLRPLGDANPVVVAGDARELVRAQLADVPVNVAMKIADLPVTGADVLGIGIGDVIRLHHPAVRPLTLTVEGEEIATATLAEDGHRLAGVITQIKETSR